MHNRSSIGRPAEEQGESAMSLATTDLCDLHGDAVRVVAPLFRDFGARRDFAGFIVTVGVYEDNVLVRAALEQPGNGRVLIVDGGGVFSLRTGFATGLGSERQAES
jgi:RraA family protein